MAKKTRERRGSATTAGRTAPPEVRRAQLIDATIDSIAQYGLSGTTMSTVTRIAGLSQGIANFHFQSKKNMLCETLRFLAEEHHDLWKAQLADSSLSSAEKLLAIVDAHFHAKICNPRKLAVWFGFFGEPAHRDTYRELVKDIDAERWEVSVGLCRAIREQGKYESVDPDSVMRNLEALYDGFFLNILIYPDMFSGDDAKRLVRNFLARAFPEHFSPFLERS
ncbi:MAG: transcriptional regulator [Ahrensia sp.]|nr:transcriptional regulator [Ahrensia sp.]|tara:strand:+ start:36584 stop:37249 length:666 start_codon:yes stop_codon:yes gene_type:complete